MSKIGFGAIGVGGRLRGLLKNLFDKHGEKVELLAMADDAPAALDETASTLGVECPRHTDYRRVLETPGVEWVLIGSKNALHRDHCVDAFAAGKHVFCEKPLATTIDQCSDIRAAHHASGKLFATGFVLRHAPLYCRIHEMITEGYIGKMISFEANETLGPDHGGYIMRNWRRHRELNGPHLLEKCSHDIDLVNWMVGDLVCRVASFGGLDIFIPENKPVADKLSRPDDDPPLYRAWPAWEDIDPFLSDKDVEDRQVAIMQYRNGVRATFHTNCCAAINQRRMYICGLEGTIEADLVTGDIRAKRVGRSTEEEKIDIGARGGHGGADTTIIDDLAESMVTGKPPKASGEEGFQSAITCLAIDEAMQTGQVVDVDPIWKRFDL